MRNYLSNTMLITAIGILIILISGPAIAGQWSGREIIKQLTVRSDQTVIIRNVNLTWKNPDACDRNDKVILLPPSAQGGGPAYKEIYATLLAAQLTDREVNFFLDGCTTIGSSTFPVFSQVAIF